MLEKILLPQNLCKVSVENHDRISVKKSVVLVEKLLR